MASLTIIGESAAVAERPFENRAMAGRLLADALERYRNDETLVIGLPRGGVEVADALARVLDAELDVLVSRKLRAPLQPELAMGALAEGDVVAWNEEVIAELGIDSEDRHRELERVRREIAARLEMYRAVLPKARVADRTVILTDDGVATGATLRAATDALLRATPQHLVVALPGGPLDTLTAFAETRGVREVIALVAPDPFYAVGQLYASFAQVSDERVCELLRDAYKRRRARATAMSELAR